MTDQLLDTLIDQLSVEQCAEMQRIVDTYDQPFEQVVTAIKGASPEVLEALTISMNLPAMMKGEPVSPEVGAILPSGFVEELWRSRHRKTA